MKKTRLQTTAKEMLDSIQKLALGLEFDSMGGEAIRAWGLVCTANAALLSALAQETGKEVDWPKGQIVDWE